MDQAPAKRRGRRRRRRGGGSAAAAEAGLDVPAVEWRSTEAAVPVTTAGAATPSKRRNRRRSQRRRDRNADAAPAGAADEAAAAAASEKVEAPVSDDISTQGGSAPQASCHLEEVAADLSDIVMQTTTGKIMNSNKPRKRDYQAGNKELKVSVADAAAFSCLVCHEHSVGQIEASRSKLCKRSDVTFPIDNCTVQGSNYHNKDSNFPEMKSTNLSGNQEEVYQNRIQHGCSSLKSEEYKENENGVSPSLKEVKKRRKKRGGKRHNRCKKAIPQDSPLSTPADSSDLMGVVSENNTSCLKPQGQRENQDHTVPIPNLIPVNHAKRSEAYDVNSESATEKWCELGTSNLDSTSEKSCELIDQNDTSCLKPKGQRENQDQKVPMSNLIPVNNAKRSEAYAVNLDSATEKRCELGTGNLDGTFEKCCELGKSSMDCTNMESNGLQEQDVLYPSNDHNSNCLSSSHLAEAFMEKQLAFSLERSLRFPKKKLLILDLNGLLADINDDYHNAHMADAKVRRKLVFRRPYCDDFLNFCALNFELGVWSSRKRENVASVLNIVMRDFTPRLLFCWDMSKCTFTGHKTLENRHKPLVLKELKKLWNKEEPDLPWEEGDYSASNTLLVDDSPYKALRNPPHTAIFPHSYSYLNSNDNSLGPCGDLRVYLQNLAAADDVECFVRNNPFGQPFITENDLHWNFYSQIAYKWCAALTCQAA